jgi:hypothetical protein
VPEYLSIEMILGDAIHRSLQGEVSDREALAEAQTAVDKLMRGAGYY